MSTRRRGPAQLPRVVGTLERPRLLAKLRPALEHRVILITAPPGYGKTTLAAQFAHHVRARVAWHTVEDRERDAPNLHAQALAALDGIVPGLDDLRAPEGTGGAELASLLARHLVQNLDRDLLYVLDDVHNLAGSPAAEAWLRTFVRHMPPTVHLMVVSRILPDLPLTEMISRREILAVGQQDLCFTLEEIQKIAVELLGIDQTTVDLPALNARLAGWPAGIILALYPLPADVEQQILSGSQGPEALFDALAAGMLYGQPAALRDFLLASSTLSRLTPELCDHALGLQDSRHLIEEAQNQSLFLSRVQGGLAYHALFRAFLQRELKRASPERYLALHARAAAWFEANNYVEEAFVHHTTAGQPERAAALAEYVARSYFAQGKHETLVEWEQTILETKVQAPELLLVAAMIHIDRYEYPAAVFALDAAEFGFRERANTRGLTLVGVQRAMIDLQQGHFAAAIREARAIADDATMTPDLHARALNIAGLAHLYLGDAQTAVNLLEESLPLYRADGNAYALSEALKDLNLVYVQLGRLNDAGACLQEIVALSRQLNRSGALAVALNNLGHYYYLRSDYRQAEATLQEGLGVATRVLDRRAEAYLVWTLGDLYRDQGNYAEASRLYNRGLELADDNQPVLRSELLLSMSILRRWQDRASDAAALAEEALSLAADHDMGLERAVGSAMLWAARARTGDLSLADQNLALVAEELSRQNTPLELLRVLGIWAEVRLLLGDRTGAREHLDAAARLALLGGSLQPLTAEVFHSRHSQPFVMTHYGRRSLFAREYRALVDSGRSGTGEVPEPAPPQTTYSLHVLTLGQAEVERDGKPVPGSDWRAEGAREMFFYLLFVGPQTREGFSLAFWPNSDAKRVRSNFHTTLYRARRALGENAIVFEDERYQINPALDLRCDAHELKAHVAQARLLSPRDVRTEDLFRRATQLYRGEFLPSLYLDWIEPLRGEFRELHVTALAGLGECARARGDLREAIRCFKQAVHADPYREELHRLIMTCYAELGERRQVQAQLTALEKLLWHELSLKPSPETLAHARALLH